MNDVNTMRLHLHLVRTSERTRPPVRVEDGPVERKGGPPRRLAHLLRPMVTQPPGRAGTIFGRAMPAVEAGRGLLERGEPGRRVNEILVIPVAATEVLPPEPQSRFA